MLTYLRRLASVETIVNGPRQRFRRIVNGANCSLWKFSGPSEHQIGDCQEFKIEPSHYANDVTSCERASDGIWNSANVTIDDFDLASETLSPRDGNG